MSRNSEKVNSSEKLEGPEHETVVMEPVIAFAFQTAATRDVASILISNVIGMVAAALVFVDTVIYIFFNS